MSHFPDHPKEKDSKHKFARLTSNPTRLKYAIRQLRIAGPLKFMRDDVGINVTSVAGVTPPNVVLEAFRKVAEYSDWRTVDFEPFVHSLVSPITFIALYSTVWSLETSDSKLLPDPSPYGAPGP
ncbi:hypothetical protein FRC18_010497 [Serendipita sp. 400]|nr:hypothetical protein FRC18_010497 [Serendipita sp. 400]